MLVGVPVGLLWTIGALLLASSGGLSSSELPFVSAADRPWPAVARLLLARRHGLAYTVALRTWMSVWRSELGLRAFSALFAALAIGAVIVLIGSFAGLAGLTLVEGKPFLPILLPTAMAAITYATWVANMSCA